MSPTNNGIIFPDKASLIEGCSNASICGMVINIKPMEANDQLENGDIIQEQLDTPTERKISTSEISFELLLHRLGNCCLILSAILFLGQIIIVSTVWHLSGSAVINGFGFSILLFMSWGCIHSVYGKGATNVRFISIIFFANLQIQGVKKIMVTPIIQIMAYFLSFHANVMQKITLVSFR